MEITTEQLNLARTAMSLPDLPDGEVFDAVVGRLNLHRELEADAEQRIAAVEGELTLSREQVDSLTEERDALQLSRTTATPGATTPPAELVAARDELTLSRLDLSVAKGDVLPLIADRLRAKLKPAEGQTLNLSRTPDGSGLIPIAEVVSMFDGLQLSPQPGTLSGPQGVFPASRQVPGAEGQKPDESNPLLDTAKSMANPK